VSCVVYQATSTRLDKLAHLLNVKPGSISSPTLSTSD
jgi:hypothetical protein